MYQFRSKVKLHEKIKLLLRKKELRTYAFYLNKYKIMFMVKWICFTKYCKSKLHTVN